MKKMTEKESIESFWSRVKIGTQEECWIWNGAINGAGRGSFRWKGRPLLAHRVAQEITFGPIPVGLCVCHKCDNGRCVNPNHFFLGTIADNNLDRDAKGRIGDRVGDANGSSKITSEIVCDIRKAFALNPQSRLKDFAIKYRVTPQCIWRVVHGKSWKHIKV